MSSFMLTNVSKKEIQNFIKQAQQRIIYVKPAFYRWEIDEMIRMANTKNVYCEIYLEEGDDSIRFGFGDKEAVDLIKENIDFLTVQMVRKIRVAILIVDQQSVFFSPTLLHLDNINEEHSFPNGFVGGAGMTDTILGSFPSYQVHIPVTVNNTPFEPTQIETYNKQTIINELDEISQSLKSNPPVTASRLKRINFYRNKFKLLKRQVIGVKINNKQISLKQFNKLLKKNERLKNSWTVFSPDDIKKLEDLSLISRELDKLDAEYLINAGRFGALIRNEKKQEYEKKLTAIKEEYIAFLMGNGEKENRFVIAKEGEQNSWALLIETLEASREELKKELVTSSSNDDDFFNHILTEDRYLRRCYESAISKTEIITRFIDQYIDNKIKFPEGEELINRINIITDYYDLSDELLYDNIDFKKLLEDKELDELREYSEGLELERINNSHKLFNVN